MLRAPLLHFILVGGLLFVLQSAWSRVPETPRVRVLRSEIEDALESYARQMGRAPNETETRAIESQSIENALWLEQAFSLGLHEIDSVVRQRLILNMRFLSDEAGGSSDEDEQTLVARAIALGMDRSDTVVRRRLIDRVQAIIRARVRAEPIGEAELAEYFRVHAERWREPPLLDLSHVYFSRDKRGDATHADAVAALETLEARSASSAPQSETDLDAALALGDPFLAGHRLRGATPNRILARLGPDFAEGVADGPVGRWFGPVESAFGQHLVWIADRVESRIPALDEVRKRVVEDWIEAESRKALREHIEERRQTVIVEIVEDVDASGAQS